MAVLRSLPDCSVDSIVSDPPYGISFMGAKWDYDVPDVAVWAECLRVLKPGGHLLAFAGTRTQHRMAVRIEDAGFEIRDMIAWVYGSGFPKSMNVSKAIDKAAGATREVVSEGQPVKRMIPGADQNASGSWIKDNGREYVPTMSTAATEAAQQWEGWGTALKPALEPITVARKPFSGTVANNVLMHGTGAINIEGCRVEVHDGAYAANCSGDRGHAGSRLTGAHGATDLSPGGGSAASGRWPANLIHDGSPEVVAMFPAKAGASAPVMGTEPSAATKSVYGQISRQASNAFHGDSGSAARFFYCAKTSPKDRHEGLNRPGPQFKHGTTLRQVEDADTQGNNHPTVKPTDLMRYLCRLVTPPGGVVLDPYMGSGSTGKAAILEGFDFIGCDNVADHVSIATARIKHALQQSEQKSAFSATGMRDMFE
ncbi:DNA methyltransferase [Pseudomonas viridiflava]|uniref:DNA methyltransferase n=1 Tax=Pseudomonas viridiflava TaxID=33069 RepID=UPI001F11B942|nr:DNA methyltransferase [Pseudomonas viridiflava]